VPCAVVYGAGT